jgi:hypothetical protein
MALALLGQASWGCIIILLNLTTDHELCRTPLNGLKALALLGQASWGTRLKMVGYYMTAQPAKGKGTIVKVLDPLCTVRVFRQKLHSRMPLDPTHVRLKRTRV